MKTCRSTVHCVTWGYCHRCDPELAKSVLARWHSEEGPDLTERYEEIIREDVAKRENV